MLSFLIRVGILIAIATAYAIFDLFNERNVPDYFVYAGLVVAIIVTLTYDMQTIYLSAIIAIVISLLGYLLYRKGVMGAGDFLEFVTISLLIPTQPAPVFTSISQFGTPFILSVMIATGYAAVVGMAIYCLLVVLKKNNFKSVRPKRKEIYYGIAIFLAYVVFLLVVEYAIGFRPVAAILILVMGFASAINIIFEKAMTRQMITSSPANKLAVGDMIATKVMSRKDIAYFKSKSRAFGALASRKLVNDLKKTNRSIPLYTSGVPVALFVLIGIGVSLLVGNLLFYIIL